MKAEGERDLTPTEVANRMMEAHNLLDEVWDSLSRDQQKRLLKAQREIAKIAGEVEPC